MSFKRNRWLIQRKHKGGVLDYWNGGVMNIESSMLVLISYLTEVSE